MAKNEYKYLFRGKRKNNGQLMRITAKTKGVRFLFANYYEYTGDILSDEDLVFSIPKGVTLEVEGKITAKNISVKGGNLSAHGNITSNGSITSDGVLCSMMGSISAVTGIVSKNVVGAAENVICRDGDIIAPAVQYGDNFKCNNANKVNATWLSAPEEYIPI